MNPDFNEMQYRSVDGATKLQALSHLLYNYKHEASSEEDSSAWVGVSLILAEIAKDMREVSDGLDRAGKLYAKNKTVSDVN